MTISRAFALLALVTVGIAPSAEAASIRLNDFNSIVTIDDNSTLDLDPALGSILFVAAQQSGNFIYTAELGVTKPLIGSGISPAMFLAFTIQSGTGGAVEISFSETGFGPSSLSGIYGAINMSSGIIYDVLQDTGNNLFAGQVIASTTSPSAGFTFVNDMTLLDDPQYSLTQRFTMTLGSQQTKTVSYSALAVPDGGMTLGLFGLALIGMERLRRKFKR